MKRTCMKRVTSRTAIVTCTVLALAAPLAAEPAWRGWGGPNGDFTVKDARLAEQWPEGGPRKLWTLPINGGYSSIAVSDGVAYVMGRDADREFVRAVDAGSGQTRWEFPYDAKVPERELTEEEKKVPEADREPKEDEYVKQFGYGPNSTPLVLEDRIVTIGYLGDMYCLDRASGKMLWKHDFIDEYKSNFLRFGYSASPILHEGAIICLVGGKDYGVVSFEPRDGSVRWHKHDVGASYASPMVAPIGGRDVLLCHMQGKLLALNPATGDELWAADYQNQYGSNIATPIVCSNGLVYIGTPSDKDESTMFQFKWDGNKLAGERVWASSKIKQGHQNVVRMGDMLVATRGGQGGGSVAAVGIKDGEVAWQDRTFGPSNLLVVGDRLIALGHDGKLRLLRTKDDGVIVISEAQILEDPSWTPPTLVNTTLYVRDRKTVAAYDVGPNATALR